jgi:hypothetical protein
VDHFPSGVNIEVETLENGSYRWYVVLEPGEIKSDPQEIYRVKAVQPDDVPCNGPHGVGAMGAWHRRHTPHGVGTMEPMAQAPCSDARGNQPSKSLYPEGEATFRTSENEPLKIDLKDTSLKIHHQKERDDEAPVGHKKLLEELIALGTGQRIARKLLRNHDHSLIAGALERVRQRRDLKNRVGYLIREVEDGGYQETLELVKPAAKVSRVSSVETSSPSIGVQQTRAELEALETERMRKEMTTYRQNTKVLLQRFQELDDALKLELKTRWMRHLEKTVPNTPKKSEILGDQTFQKIAFKEVTARFFELVDQGVSKDKALIQLAA